MALRATAALVAGLSLILPLLPAPALAQAQQEWFVPGGGQQRPPQAQRPARPAPAPARPPARPAGPNPAPLAAGEPPPAAVIGIVDVPEVQRVSSAFNGVREEIERRRQRLNDDLQREQGRWREEQQALANQRATLSADQLRERERGLQDRITDAQRIFRERNRAIEQTAQAALQEIEQALAVVLRQVATSRGVNLVLPRPLVIFNEAPFDLTDEVAQQLNRVLRTVTLPAEGATPAAAAAPATPPAAPAAPARRN
ncbi:periplasmic chaperone for outer membrane proteins Skp [Humitalea rosea]|uniref:Periplasmic chaperone for outer membrane proteins Skp n=1 Tax=Humitalea rosea TaxID=990373 RepID=A0A2W7IBV8_9PROT|nr:OmpH family outer membrane protein [Humitalea rosea]PZW43578.1 periplasmic chaperone for outer membrane proteins Skp [Humitalea rosea]